MVISDYRIYHPARPEAYIFIGLARMGFEVYIMTWPECVFKNEFLDAGIHVIEFHPSKKFSRSAINCIRQVLIPEKIDILHLFNSHAIINGIQAARGIPVKVGGVVVKPGDLILGDKHGIITIPEKIAKDIPEAVKKVEERERIIIDCCQSKDFSIETLKEAWTTARKRH